MPAGTRLQVIGFGDLGNGKDATVLQRTELVLERLEACNEAWAVDPTVANFFEATLICAGAWLHKMRTASALLCRGGLLPAATRTSHGHSGPTCTACAALPALSAAVAGCQVSSRVQLPSQAPLPPTSSLILAAETAVSDQCLHYGAQAEGGIQWCTCMAL